MSYEIVKSIKVKDGKVFARMSSNNIIPHYYNEGELPRLTEILQKEGRDALDIEILSVYEKGCFQAGGQNKYTRALYILMHLPEYKEFDWRIKDVDRWENRKSQEFKNLLRKALNTRLPDDKFILKKQFGVAVVYACKVTKRSVKWSWEKEDAKTFPFEDDAISLKSCFHGGDKWETERLQ